MTQPPTSQPGRPDAPPTPRATPPGNLRVGTIGGAPVYLSSSWFLGLLVLGALFLDQGGGTVVTRLGYAVTMLVTLAVSVVAHEAAHALVARGFGHDVRSITLTLWGGATQHVTARPTPLSHGLIAVSGPLVNLALAGLAWLALLVVPAGPASLVATTVLWVNVALGLFNLLPGLPMDGGQAVASVVWAATKNRTTGLVAAAWAGRLVAVGVALWYGVMLLRTQASTLTVVWVIMMCVMLWSSASMALRGAQARRTLDHVTAADATLPAVVVPAGLSVGDAFGRAPSLAQWLIVVDGERVVGVVPPTVLTPDVATRRAEELVQPASKAVIDLSPEQPVTDALVAMAGAGEPYAAVRYPTGEPRVLDLGRVAAR